VSASIACLLIAYATRFWLARIPDIEPMFMIRPFWPMSIGSNA